MKSLLISSIYFPPEVGGISQFMAGIASALGPEQVCCLTSVPGNDGGVRENCWPRVYRRPAAFSKSNYFQAVGWGMTITEIMLRERPKVVQLATTGEGYLGLWLREWLKLPFVVYAHGNEILAAMRVDWVKPRLALQLADRVLANSHFTANLVQQVGVNPEKIDIVHPGCDINHFRPLQPRLDLRQKLLGPRHRDRVILTVGGLVARKGHDMVIRALPQLRESVPDITYLIVGDGPYRAQLQTLAETIGVQDRVIFAGQVAEKDLPGIYALSDVFVMPSREQLEECNVEGFGLVFLEASACGKPVVGGRSGGVPDAVVDGVTGLLANPHDPEDIARILVRLLSHKDLAADLGRQGHLRVVRDFSWTRVADRVQEILDSLRREKPVVSQHRFL
jgi:phosphatidylinositol alpha-1,6-mannosyltransferase